MGSSTNYDLLIEKIESFIRKYYLNKVLRGMLLVVATLFFSFLFVLFIEYLGDCNLTVRAFLFFGYWILNGGLFCWLALPPLLSYLKFGKTISHDEAARIIGLHFSDVADKLLNTLQLKRIADNNPEQRQFIEASIDQKTAALKPVSFPAAVRIKQNLKYVKWVLLPLVVILTLAIVFPAILKENTEKIIQHDKTFLPKAPFAFIVTNRTLTVAEGDSLQLQVKLNGNDFPESVYLETGNNTFKMKRESISRFTYTFTNLQRSLKFRLMGDNFTSGDYEVVVRPKPSLLDFDAEISYPAYLKMKSQTISNAGDLTLPVGSSVTWHIRTKNADQVFFAFGNKKEKLAGADNNFSKRETVLQSGLYSLQALNDKSPGTDSVAYRINVIADLPPTIAVSEKRDSISSKAIYFSGQAQDDRGFSSLVFHCAITNPSDPKPRIIELPVKTDLTGNQASFFYYWNLDDLAIEPGAKVSYYFQVADNDAVTGHQTARTEEKILQAPTVAKISRQLDARSDSVNNKIQNAVSLSEQMNREIERLKALLLNKQDLSFDDKKQIQDLLDKHQELEKMIEEARQQNQQNALNRQENMPVDKNLMQKQSQMDKLLSDLQNPQQDEMIKKLQDLMNNNLNPPPNELTNMQMNDKTMGQQLDRTLELMKQLDVTTKVQQSIDQLNKLADMQQQLAAQTKQNGSDIKGLIQKQAQIKKDFDNVRKSLNDAAQKNDQLDNKTNFENPVSDLNKIDNQLSKSSNELSHDKRNEAATGQQAAATQMQQLAQNMQQKQSNADMQDVVINSNNLRDLIKSLVENSFSQERIIKGLKGLKSDDPSYSTWVEKQKYIQDNMQTMQDSLLALSKRLPEIASTAISETATLNQNLDSALGFLGDRRTFEANKNQQQVMTAMNNLGLMLSETLSKMESDLKQTSKNASNGGGGSHQKKTILELSEMQQKLNANMQAMREKMQQSGPQFGKVGASSPNQGEGDPTSEQFARLAQQQAEIRQALQQINIDDNKDGHHQLGDLGAMAKDMEKTETDLVNKRLTDATLSRQLQIRTKMLEADKAEQEQEQDNKRESEAPKKNIPPGYIKALQAYEQEKLKQTEQLKTAPVQLNNYYKIIVNKYFEEVNKTK